MRFTFRSGYFAITVVLFIVEVLIALFVRDKVVRPYVGDVLVVILMYCFIKSFLGVPTFPVAIFVLIFAFTIEVLQYINIVERLGWSSSAVARTVVGTLFEWLDLVAYTAGIAIVIAYENHLRSRPNQA